jgi:hypothetical protein
MAPYRRPVDVDVFWGLHALLLGEQPGDCLHREAQFVGDLAGSVPLCLERLCLRDQLFKGGHGEEISRESI